MHQGHLASQDPQETEGQEDSKDGEETMVAMAIPELEALQVYNRTPEFGGILGKNYEVTASKGMNIHLCLCICTCSTKSLFKCTQSENEVC